MTLGGQLENCQNEESFNKKMNIVLEHSIFDHHVPIDIWNHNKNLHEKPF
jgi:hypothetical protein